MGRVLSNSQLLAKKYNTAAFTGPWLESFGKPELRGAWFMWGASGQGKTSFLLQLARYLAMEWNERVAVVSLEQGDCKSFQNQWARAGMMDCGKKVQLWIDFDLVTPSTTCRPSPSKPLRHCSVTIPIACSFSMVMPKEMNPKAKSEA